MKIRHEYKIPISYADYLVLKQRLNAVLKPDPNAGEKGIYKIRSLYFDNLSDKALVEKISGVNRREKFRIRIYNESDSVIKLEKKSKVNGLSTKETASLSREETEKIIKNDIDWMASCEERPLVRELYTKMKTQLLRPKTIVDYEREPYIYEPGDVRITIDKNIRTGLYETDIFNKNVPTVPAGDTSILLEVKYSSFLPDTVSRLIQLDSRRNNAFSKYAVCRMYG